MAVERSADASAPCLALCARALAEDRPEVAGVLRGAAYAAYSQGEPSRGRQTKHTAMPNANFVLAALREAGELVAAALGDERRRELRTKARR